MLEPGRSTFYVADTFQQEFWAYDYDIATGALSNRRVFATTHDDLGVADGSTVDEEGYMWNAQVIGGDLVRYAPDGSVERRIGMPVRNVTSLTFGGDRLDEIYVTSMARVKHPAVHDMFTREVRPQFGAGHLFKVSGLGIRACRSRASPAGRRTAWMARTGTGSGRSVEEVGRRHRRLSARARRHRENHVSIGYR